MYMNSVPDYTQKRDSETLGYRVLFSVFWEHMFFKLAPVILRYLFNRQTK